MHYIKMMSFIAVALPCIHVHAVTYHDYVHDDIFIPAEYFIAREHELQHNYEAAEKFYLLAGERGDVWSYYSLGLMCERQDLLDKAVQYYTIPANVGKQEAVKALGRIYLKQNKTQLAQKYLLANQSQDLEEITRGKNTIE